MGQKYMIYLVCCKDLFNKLIATFEQGFNTFKTD